MPGDKCPVGQTNRSRLRKAKSQVEDRLTDEEAAPEQWAANSLVLDHSPSWNVPPSLFFIAYLKFWISLMFVF